MFFTSDLHFWQRNILSYCDRPFDSVEEMNEGLIDNWNSIVGHDDVVYMLGDIFFCGVQKAQEIMSRLKGRKRLVRGNHDWQMIKLSHGPKFGFESISDTDFVEVAGHLLMMNHFPYAGDHIGRDRYPHLRPHDNGGWLLHGHVHEHWRVKEKQINVGVDVWGCHPVHIDDIMLIIEGIDVDFPHKF